MDTNAAIVNEITDKFGGADELRNGVLAPDARAFAA